MCAVEEVHVPGKVIEIDPKSKPTDESYWGKRTKEARAHAEYLDAVKEQERLTSPPEPAEPPFKVTGSVSLGNLDLQAQAKENQERTDRLLEAKDKETAALREKAERLSEEKKTLEINTLRDQMAQKMTELQQMIAAGMRQPKSFLEQYEEAMTIAGKLGAMRPAGDGSGDPRMQLEILRLQGDQAHEERAFKQQIRNDEKKWSMELQKLAEERKLREEQIQAERDKNNLFANSLKGIGGAIASALIENSAELKAPAAGAISKEAPAVPAKRKGHIEAGEGEVGEVQCPGCSQPIGIGPASTEVTCANCGTKLPIDRHPVQPKPEGVSK